MICPACKQKLPFYFAITAGKKKMLCPACSVAISPTKKSFANICRISGIIAFVVGALLSTACSYIWMALEQPILAVIVYAVGIGGVLGSSYIYSNSHIEFQADQ